MAAIAISIPRPDASYFFQQLSRAERGVLVLDYDSAIARFGPPRRRRFPYPTVYEILDSMLSTTRTRVVIVSKRRTRELERVLGVVADPATWDTGNNLQLISLNDTYHQSTPQSLLANLCALGPLAYLADQDWQSPEAARADMPTAVQPLFFLGAQTWPGDPEDLIQFLIDWLRACGGEVG